MTRPVDRRIAVGDLWFIKLPEAVHVEKAEILELSDQTILFNLLRKDIGHGDHKARFRIDDVEYVELVKPAEAKRVHNFRFSEKH